MTVPLHEGKEEKTEIKNYRGINLLNVVGETYAGILICRVRRVIDSFIDDEQSSFRSGKKCADQIFTLKQIGKTA